MQFNDIFMGWGFLIALCPFPGIINAIIALPTTICAKRISNLAGLLAWFTTTIATCAYGIYAFFTSWQNRAQYLMYQSIVEYSLFFFLPQVATYPLTRNRPEIRPWVAGGLGIGGVLLFIIVGLVSGATSD